MWEQVSAGQVAVTFTAVEDTDRDKQLRNVVLRLLCGGKLQSKEAEVLGRLMYADDGMIEGKQCISYVMHMWKPSGRPVFA